MAQLNLFGEELRKPKILPSLPYGNSNNESFEELEKRVASKYSRRHIGYPCDEAQDLPIDDRPAHIFNADGSWKCLICKKLIIELEKKVGLR